MSQEEQVLVVPTQVLHAAGLFQGFSPDVAHYLPRVLAADQLSYRPRSLMEQNPAFKQLIPYAVLKWRDQVFNYLRGRGGGEARLRALRSIGVGGHISSADGQPSAASYRQALLRELAEEVDVQSDFQERCIGLINDDATPVGQVHLGIVHVFELAEPRVRRREEVLTEAGFAPLAELRGRRQEFESWSQFLLEGDWWAEAREAASGRKRLHHVTSIDAPHRHHRRHARPGPSADRQVHPAGPSRLWLRPVARGRRRASAAVPRARLRRRGRGQ